MKPRKKLNVKRERRAIRASARIVGTADRPRLAVHRTNRYFYAQLIDDAKGHTVAAATSFMLGKSGAAKAKQTKGDNAFAVGEMIGKKAAEKGIKKAVFDRRAYRFHGRVKRFAEGAKNAGLTI